MHSVGALKGAVLSEMYGKDGYEWNEQADACEALLLLLRKIHEHFKGRK